LVTVECAKHDGIDGRGGQRSRFLAHGAVNHSAKPGACRTWGEPV
jgi:hypothetical protein